MSNTIFHSTLEEGYDWFFGDKWNKEYHFKILTFSIGAKWLSKAIELIFTFNVEKPKTLKIH